MSPRAKVAVCDRRFGWALFGWLANRTRSRRVEFWACARDSARACACCSVPGVGMAHAQHARTSAGFGGVLRGVRARFRSARVCFAPLSMHAPPQGAPLCQKAALNYAGMTRTAAGLPLPPVARRAALNSPMRAAVQIQIPTAKIQIPTAGNRGFDTRAAGTAGNRASAPLAGTPGGPLGLGGHCATGGATPGRAPTPTAPPAAPPAPAMRAMSAQRARAAQMGALRGLCGADGRRGGFGAALGGTPASPTPAPAPTATAPVVRAMRARVAVADLGENGGATSPAAGTGGWRCGGFGAASGGAPASPAPAPALTATAPVVRAMSARVAVADLGEDDDATSPAAGKCDGRYGACAFAFRACVVVVPRYHTNSPSQSLSGEFGTDVSQLAMANGYWVARSLPVHSAACQSGGVCAVGNSKPCRGVMPSALPAGVTPEVYWHAGRCVRCAPPLEDGGAAGWLVSASRDHAPDSTNGAFRCPGHPLQGALGTCAQQPQQTRRQQPRPRWGLRAGMPMEWPGRVRVATRRRLSRPGVREAALRCSARPVFDRVPRWHKAPARGGRSTSARRAASGGRAGAGRGGAARVAHSPRGPAGGPALCPARAASYSLVEEPRLKRERAHGPSGA